MEQNVAWVIDREDDPAMDRDEYGLGMCGGVR